MTEVRDRKDRLLSYCHTVMRAAIQNDPFLSQKLNP